MSIILNTFTGNQAIAKFEAMIMDAAIGESGFLDGCDITYIGTNQVSIPASNGIIKGRKFTIQAETKACALASSGSMPGRIYLHMDLSDSVNPLQILSVAAATLPALVMDEECNFTTGIYEVEIATYTASTTAISNLTLTYNTINPRMLLKSIEEVSANTEAGRLADALVVKELITNLNAVQTDVDELMSLIFPPYAYNAGNEEYFVSGGFIYSNCSNDTTTTNSLYAPGIGYSGLSSGAFCTKAAVDLTKYSKIRFYITVSMSYGSDTGGITGYFGVGSASAVTNSFVASTSDDLTPVGTFTVDVDVSALTSGFIKAYFAYTANNVRKNIGVTKIELIV